jgi:hypothetical protein
MSLLAFPQYKYFDQYYFPSHIRNYKELMETVLSSRNNKFNGAVFVSRTERPISDFKRRRDK